LSGAAKLALILSAAATILCFYFFALTSILFILALLAFEILLMLALLRLGLAGLITGTMESQGRMLGIFFKSFLIGKGVDFRISLHPEEAPGFFGILKRLCDRLELTVPGEVAVEMNLNAHVRLKGIRQGAGTTILVVGYDLLACKTHPTGTEAMAHGRTDPGCQSGKRTCIVVRGVPQSRAWHRPRGAFRQGCSLVRQARPSARGRLLAAGRI
jgi:hypothetical protein